MGTPFKDIIELALMSITDYKLDALYSRSKEEWLDYLSNFMIRSLPNFTNSRKDLSEYDNISKSFNEDLTMLEQSIVADYTVIAWANKEINDVRQITAMMQNGREANRYSEANLLKEKINMANSLKEDVDRKQVAYGLKYMEV